MQEPTIPSNENKRLDSLNSLNVLDTPAEERFDRLTRLAKKMFNVPIALVSIVDENRQWFKSCFGLPVLETPRNISFCGHTILGDEIFVIEDTMKDKRFVDNPLVLDAPFIRFYAGYPLYYSDDIKLGTLCIIDTEARKFTKEDKEILKDLALLAQQELISSQLATLDELTSISNRRGFKTLAQKSLNICIREKIPSVLVYFDINKFKSINDTFGHNAGDNVLKTFSKEMESTFRDSDVFARIGGDEFVVLLTDCSLKSANEIIKRFKENIDSYNKESNLSYKISFSYGIVEINLEEDFDLDNILHKADTIMYEDKKK